MKKCEEEIKINKGMLLKSEKKIQEKFFD